MRPARAKNAQTFRDRVAAAPRARWRDGSALDDCAPLGMTAAQAAVRASAREAGGTRDHARRRRHDPAADRRPTAATARQGPGACGLARSSRWSASGGRPATRWPRPCGPRSCPSTWASALRTVVSRVRAFAGAGRWPTGAAIRSGRTAAATCLQLPDDCGRRRAGGGGRGRPARRRAAPPTRPGRRAWHAGRRGGRAAAAAVPRPTTTASGSATPAVTGSTSCW